MTIARLRHTSYTTNTWGSGSVTRADWFASARDPEDAANINSCTQTVASDVSGQASIRLTNFNSFNSSGKTIQSVTLKFKGCSTLLTSGTGKSSATVAIVNVNTGTSFVYKTVSETGDRASYMNTTNSFTSIDIPQQYWDLIFAGGANWYIRLSEAHSANGSAYCSYSAAVIDIEYEALEDDQIKIGTSLLKKVKIGASQKIDKIFKGNTLLFKDKLLPKEYQRLQYIKTTGTQYFDTGLFGKPGLKTEAKLQVYNSTSASAVLVGARNDTGQTRCYLGYRQYNSSVNFGYQEEQQSGVAPTSDIDTFEYEIKSGELVIKKNSTTILDQQHTTTFTTDYTMYVFAINYTGSASQSISCDLYELKIWDNGTLVRNYIPCYRKSDNVVGMYDIVNNTFKTNAGSGSFIKGPEIEYNFPKAYQKVEYLKSDGTQYIDTGFTPSYSTGFKFEVTYQPTDTTNRGCLLSNFDGTACIGYELRNGKERTWCASGAANVESTEAYTLGINTGSLAVTNTSVVQMVNGKANTTAYTTSATTCANSVYMFTDRSLRFSTFPNYVNIYSCRIYDGSTLVRDFVPCYRKSDNVLGMYDIINNVFYTNQGTGTFIKGKNIY